MGGDALGRLEDYGIQRMPAYDGMALAELSEWLVKSLYSLAEAEYDRLHGVKLKF